MTNIENDSPGVEVELKARIPGERIDALAELLRRTCRFVRNIDKHDEYYTTDIGGKVKRVRIRDDNGVYLTFKDKDKTGDGIEINNEWETSMGDLSVARALLAYLGCSFHYKKRKRGFAFRKDEVTIELCDVNDLGWFLELEYIIEKKDPALIAGAEAALRNILKELDIPESFIEPRFYAEMILES